MDTRHDRIQRGMHYARLWATWMQAEHRATVAHIHAMGFRGALDFEAMCTQADNAACKAFDALLRGLTNIASAEVSHTYLGTRRHPLGTDEVLDAALEQLGGDMLRRGFP